MSDKKFKQISDAEYQIELGNKWENVFVPWGKVEALLKEFAGKGGMIDPETGAVKTDLMTLVSQFSTLGNILLSEYSEEGNLVKEISCKGKSHKDVITIFMLVQEILTGFMLAVSEMQEGTANPEEENETKKKKSKA